MKLLRVEFLVVLFGWFGTQAGLAETSDLVSCGMLDGYLVHSIKQVDEGFQLKAAFPVYKKLPSKEALEASKKEWREWNGSGPQPKDPRSYAVAVPIAGENLMSYDIEAMARQRDLFEILFPGQDIDGDLDFEMTKTNVTFHKSECDLLEDTDLMSLLCNRRRPLEINGIELAGMRLHMVLSWQRELVFGELPKTFVRSVRPNVRAEILYYGSKNSARSALTYFPNGNDVQCLYKGEKLLAQDLLVIN